MSLPDGRYLMKIDSSKKRSNNQNRYWWGIVVPMVREGLRDMGYDDVKTNEDAHEILKHLFLKKKVESSSNGDIIEVTGNTSKLSTVEFNLLIDEVIKWAATYLNIQILFPNEQTSLL